MVEKAPIRTEPNGKRSAQIILIPKQLRAEWMDVMALDSSLSHVAFRAAGVIGSHFNRHTGETFLTLKTLACVMGVGERTAWSAVSELDRAGYLIVKRREFGTVIDTASASTEGAATVGTARKAGRPLLRIEGTQGLAHGRLSAVRLAMRGNRRWPAMRGFGSTRR
jgi:hypothetical protein